MTTQIKPKAPWMHRFAVKLFSLLLTVLIFWLLGFLVQDINTIQGPQLSTYEAQELDQVLLSQVEGLSKKIANLDTEISNHKINQELLKNSTENLQKTIGQILDIQKLDQVNRVSRTQEESQAFSNSLNLFLSNQKKFQALNAKVSSLTSEKQKLENEKERLNNQLSTQRNVAENKYKKARENHGYKIAFYKLGILAPFLLLSLFFTFRFRKSNKLPVLLPFAIATCIKVALIIHEHFPSKLFKYILILLLIAVTFKFLIYFISVVASPKLEILIKQYREAYERFQCPLCEYPIRRGPMKYLYWTRKTIHKLNLLPGVYEDSEYHCPSCGTGLFETCQTCQQIRHSLLPYCEGCDAHKDIQSPETV